MCRRSSVLPLILNLAIGHNHEPVPSSQPFSLISILMLSQHLLLELPGSSFPRSFPTKVLHAFMVSSIQNACGVHRNLFNLLSPECYVHAIHIHFQSLSRHISFDAETAPLNTRLKIVIVNGPLTAIFKTT